MTNVFNSQIEEDGGGVQTPPPSISYLIVTSTHYTENMPDHVW